MHWSRSLRTDWRTGRRALLMASLLEGRSIHRAGGIYDPIQNERRIGLDQDRASPIARMLSWHEGFHAFLNASTRHGNAMIFAGALASAGRERFGEFVERLIDASIATHETYATVSGLAAAAGGEIDPALLEGYPSYRPLLAPFEAMFPSRERPVLSVMALTACARVAMQTGIYGALLETPCQAWPELDLEGIGAPDARFELLFGAGPAKIALNAMTEVLRGQGALAEIAEPGITSARERALWQVATNAEMDAVGKAGFAAFAEVLRNAGAGACAFDDQRDGLDVIIAKVEAFAGDSLNVRFQAPASPSDDEEALFVDFRREQIILESAPLPATFASPATHDTEAAQLFTIAAEFSPYAQLVIMPLEKARALYAPVDGAELLDQCADGVLVGLRRKWAPHGQDPCVEFFLLDATNAADTLAPMNDSEVYIVCAASALQRSSWARSWILSDHAPAERMAVLIDTDPFALISRHEARGARLCINYLRVKSSDGAQTEILCLTASDEPAVIYFAPASAPLRQAVMEFASRRCTNARFDDAFLHDWLPMIGRLSAHALREEGRFGDRFWL